MYRVSHKMKPRTTARLVSSRCQRGRAMAQAVSHRPLTAEARFDPGSVHVGFVVDKVALGQVFPRVLWFSPVNFISPVLHYKEKRKN
jgi:hypothetical protein